MESAKYETGEVPMVGDEVEHVNVDGGYYAKVTARFGDGVHAVCTKGWCESGIGSPGDKFMLLPQYWRLLRRASTPDARPVDERFAAGAYYEARHSAWVHIVFASADAWWAIETTAGGKTRCRLNQSRTTVDDRNHTYRGNIADAVEAFLCALHGTPPRTIPSPPPEEPQTFQVCPACDSRMTETECQGPACRQVRKCVEARICEGLLRAKYERFDSIAREAVAGTRVNVVTDIANGRLLAEFSVDGLRETIVSGLHVERAAAIGDCRRAVALLREQLGSRAPGKVGR